MIRWLTALLCWLAAACGGERAAAPTYHPETSPDRLSEWGMVHRRGGALVLGDGVRPYDLATPLFSDYALKLRTVWLPEGRAAAYRADEAFAFPVGTVITKTFYYPLADPSRTGEVLATKEATDEARDVAMGAGALADGLPLDALRLVETRILVRREAGWDALPYIWNEAQSDAVLARAGALTPMTIVRPGGERETFHYAVPNANQCAGCHATDSSSKAIRPIGLKARHLNKASAFAPGANQLDDWRDAGLLEGGPNARAAPRNADWTDAAAPLAARARAYLDINCSHCHSPYGPADTSGLNLKPDASGPALGVCKPPIAAGRGSGGRPYAVVPGRPDASITLFRMETTDPGAMMPELGRALVHDEGAALIAEWIASMDAPAKGGCAA